MKVLIMYQSYNGQTKKVVDFIQKRHANHQYVSLEINEINTIKPQTFDLIIIAAPIRYGHFSLSIRSFIARNQKTLNNTPKSAFIALNLTARKEGKDTPETNVYVRKFKQKIAWKPTNIAVFAGALKYPEYTWYNRMFIRFIMKLTGGETDVSKSIEYTNWDKVSQFADLILDDAKN